jgi:hypothetical protein
MSSPVLESVVFLPKYACVHVKALNVVIFFIDLTLLNRLFRDKYLQTFL